MSNGKRGAPDAGARRRRAPTIDLKATEITSEPVKPEPADPAPESPKEAAPETSAAPETAIAPETAAAPEAAPPEPAAPQPEPVPEFYGMAPEAAKPEPAAGTAAAETAAPAQTAGPAPEPAPEAQTAAAAPEPPPAPTAAAATADHWADWRLAAAGGIGAAAMLVLLLALYTVSGGREDRITPLDTRLGNLEQQTRALANRPQPPGVDQRALAELAARVGAAEQAMGRLAEIESRVARAEQGAARFGELEQRIARTESKADSATAAAPAGSGPGDPALAGRVAALEAALRPLGELGPRIDAVNSATREAKTRADAAYDAAQQNAVPRDLEARVAALEQAAKLAQDRIASTAGADKAGRLAFVAVSLRAAVERGDPFTQELAAVRPLVADAKTLAPLEPYAAGGVPRAATLAREFSTLTGAMLSAAGSAPREGGIIERLQQNAERLVRIRPINEAPGDDAVTVITRADVKAAHGDLAGALAEVASLPPAVRAPAQAWAAKVDARGAALATARDLAEGAVGALAKPQQ